MVAIQNSFKITVNGVVHTIEVARKTPLLTVLRNDLGLTGAKFGCGLGECGACTVMIDGVAARACVIPVSMAEGRDITTLEGLSRDGEPDLVQQCFIDAQAAQCGYCLNGMVITTVALLKRIPSPSEAEIKNELRYNLCRCGTHLEILEAVTTAAQRLQAMKSKA